MSFIVHTCTLCYVIYSGASDKGYPKFIIDKPPYSPETPITMHPPNRALTKLSKIYIVIHASTLTFHL